MKPSQPKKTTVWCVVNDGSVTPWGCTCVIKEGLWRYPVFASRAEARKFAEINQMNDVTIKVVKATLNIIK